jgi:predicted metal-dependent phosphoesterase TrpH
MLRKLLENNVDLHIHSRYSDGVHTPAELVRMAAEKGLQAIAITDHDSVDGIDEAIEAGEHLGVEVIPAVELSVAYRGYRDVHLLGYLIDHRDNAFIAKLAELQKSRDERGRAIVDRINARLSSENKGSIAYEDVLTVAGGAVGRPHIARILIGKGFAHDIEDAFKKYLEPCNVPKVHVTLAEALAEVNRVKGVTVLAHPPSISKNRATLKTVIKELAEIGLDGLEVYSNICYKDDITFFNNLANQLGLVITGGSDYHGFSNDVEMGLARSGSAVTYRRVEMLKEAREKREWTGKHASAI